MAALLAMGLICGQEVGPRESTEIREAFLVVCLWCVGNAFDSAR